MRFAILGPLAVTHEGRSLRLRGAIKLRLLAALLVEPGAIVPPSWLADQLWGDDDLERCENRLQTAISRLRTALDVAETGRANGAGASPRETPSGSGEGRIVWEGTGYRLVLDDDELDALVFERLRREAVEALARGDPRRAVDRADAALAEWRGRAFGELADERFAHEQARALDLRRLATRQVRVEALLRLGEHVEVVPEAQALVAAEPGNEQLRALLVKALYRSGRPDEALDVCRSYRIELGERTGRTPGGELEALEAAVLRHDPVLDGDQLVEDDARVPTPVRSAGPQTFLFTALDDTPGGWGPGPEAAASHSRQAHELHVGDAIAAHGGRVFDRAGAGFCAVFGRPIDAVLAAWDAALGLHRSSLEAGAAGGPRVRMAVHTGDAEVRGSSFAGSHVIRMARMRDAAHAGQVLVSAATRELVADDLSAGMGLVGIGAWQFDGFPRPERLYQLINHEGCTRQLPPLRAGARRAGQLPRYTTPFLGRERQVTDVVARLRHHPLVTVTGDGGIGKTRLAFEVAQRASARDYPDGVCYCDVSLLDDADALVEHAARACGVVLTPDGDHRWELVQSFEAVRLLLVLDGCERLREPVAALTGDVLASGSETRMLVTSRARLGVPAEQVAKLDPLPVPAPEDPEPEAAPAVQLLDDLARRAGAVVAPGDPDLVELARRLDGLPLAIELAAPRLESVPAAALVERLDRAFETLTGAPGAPARHQTLRATFNWSFDLVSPAARGLFGAVSLFRGTWTLETAEAVASAVDVEPARVMTLMAELVEQSLVRVDMPAGGAARYTMLDTIRTYAAEHLTRAGRYGAVADLHAAHFLGLAERAVPHRRGPDEPAWVGEMQAELDNLRAAYHHLVDRGRPVEALRLVVALSDDLMMRERFEIGRWAEELAALPELADEPLRAEALGLAANASMFKGRLQDAVRHAHAALAVEAATGAPPCWTARNALALATAVKAVEGRWSDHLHAMEDISRTRGDPFPAALALWNRVYVAWSTGDVGRGESAAEGLVALGDRYDNPSMRAMGLLALGRIAALRQSIDEARDLFHRARGAAEAASGTLVLHQTMRELADLDADAGDRAASLATLRRVARTFTASGNVVEQLHTAMSLVEHLVALGELAAAARALGALARTPMAATAGYGAINAIVTERLDPAERLAAQAEGARLQLSEVVADVVRVVDGLADDGELAGDRANGAGLGDQVDLTDRGEPAEAAEEAD